MTNHESDDANDSQSLTGGDITKHSAIVPRISYLSRNRSDLKFAAMQVCCAMANPSASDLGRVKRIGRYLVGKPGGECLFHWQQSVNLKRTRTQIGEATKLPAVGVSLSDHERWTVFESMDQEAAGGVLVHC